MFHLYSSHGHIYIYTSCTFSYVRIRTHTFVHELMPYLYTCIYVYMQMSTVKGKTSAVDPQEEKSSFEVDKTLEEFVESNTYHISLRCLKYLVFNSPLPPFTSFYLSSIYLPLPFTSPFCLPVPHVILTSALPYCSALLSHPLLPPIPLLSQQVFLSPVLMSCASPFTMIHTNVSPAMLDSCGYCK